ncbi:GTP-binding protein [Rhizobium rhizosphaerae]|uniref:GTP-binding protein n=1 Tax=Xaviernesmea rhizosphaerae TaxID=1672749 RepID=A0ABX3PA50_9HYPH|nr:TetM/TetW/TetO/TetS family tetracycline resistance ribosomal protection protein [Xaviernesmea rhizosphaerae]OQP84660.1 GTP-binding protein [Xaviernesmea rhizosphaerae]
MRSLNLGILAHVDAGKTSLTERLLFDAGVIDRLGSVDKGSTQTDTLALERQRGITIKAAVVSFKIGDRIVNLIDTPGHPDFIAEVDRVLGLLDAAIVVVSAVEGVQAQTRVLVRALQRLQVPFVFFINKIDRRGADVPAVIAALRSALPVRPIGVSCVIEAGTKNARAEPLDLRDPALFDTVCEAMADHDPDLLADYLTAPQTLTAQRLQDALREQVGQGLLHPSFAGAAMTGVGVPALMSAIATILPAPLRDPAAAVEGTIFKIERGWGGEKLAYVALTSGTIALRQTLSLPGGPERINAIQIFDNGQTRPASCLQAGQIGRISGLSHARIGDSVGDMRDSAVKTAFPPPTLEAKIVAARAGDHGALWVALSQLAEQDPFIALRKTADTGEIYLSLYGEVQKDVIRDTLLADFDLLVAFEESTIVHVERLLGIGTGLELIFRPPNPFFATVGLRVEPRKEGAGSSFALEVDVGQMPASFYRAVEETALEALEDGLFGWPIVDCHIAMTDAKHTSPSSTAGDFRQLTLWVLAKAVKEAGTVVCEPVEHFRLEAPSNAFHTLLTVLGKAGAAVTHSAVEGGALLLEGTIASARVQGVLRELAGLTAGQGLMETTFSHHAPVSGPPPSRARAGSAPFLSHRTSLPIP